MIREIQAIFWDWDMSLKSIISNNPEICADANISLINLHHIVRIESGEKSQLTVRQSSFELLWGNFAKNRKDFDKEGTTKVQYKIIGGNQIALQLFAHGIFSFISAAFNPLTPV